MTHDLEKLLEPAIDAVRQAMVVCEHVRGSLDQLRAMTKDDASPVTIADYASQAIIAAILAEHDGSIPLVAEEAAAQLRDPAHLAHLAAVVEALHATSVWPGASEREILDAIDLGQGAPDDQRGYWTLDPIDGTKGFLRAPEGQYAVALALIDAGRPVLAVMGCPNLLAEPARASVPQSTDLGDRGCLFWAIRGGPHGAMQQVESDDAIFEIDIRHPGWSPGRAIRLAESVESGHSDHSMGDRVAAALGERVEHVRLDSQAKYASVARGEADVYLRLPSKPGYVEWIWDHAAGSLIAEEAGCVVSDIEGKRLDFSRGRKLSGNRGIVVAPKGLHERVLAGLARLAPART